MTIKKTIFYFALICIYTSCATPRSPEGGPKDETAPQIDSTNTTANYQTNFKGRSIEMTFDEWVKLNDVFNQVVVSPPLENSPKITLKKKTVKFELDEAEILRPDATYTINFGDAVKDITEGNATPDLRYVFSTGDKIDSLIVKGQVNDLLTKEPAKDILVMLYENLADSVVRTERPFYFAKTNETGTFQIENIKEGTFKVFALKDLNLNYKFDQEGEAIAYLDTFITLPDTNTTSIQLDLFTEEAQLRLMDEELTHYGLAKLVFNRDPYDLNLSFENTTVEPYTEIVEDTVKIWYDSDTFFDVLLQADTSLNDTIRIPIKEKAIFVEESKFIQINGGVNGRAKSKNPAVPIGIEMNFPIAAINLDAIKVYADTLGTLVNPTIQIDSLDQRLLKMDFKWTENQTYKVEILPGGLTSFINTPNDTIVQEYKILPQVDFGELSIQLDSLDRSQTYIIQLLTKSEDVVKEENSTGLSVFEKTYTNLPPTDYLLKVIEDSNQNGRWDTGNYDEKRRPERIFTATLETLRPNWTVEAELELKF